MNLQRTLIHAGLYLPYLFRKITGTGTFGRRGPVYLRATKTVSEANPLKAALFKHHVKQFSESACSAATPGNGHQCPPGGSGQHKQAGHTAGTA